MLSGDFVVYTVKINTEEHYFPARNRTFETFSEFTSLVVLTFWLEWNGVRC